MNCRYFLQYLYILRSIGTLFMELTLINFKGSYIGISFFFYLVGTNILRIFFFFLPDK